MTTFSHAPIPAGPFLAPPAAAPGPIGLYRPEDEHDACGVGFIADLHGRKSHRVVEKALRAVVSLLHRGAVDMDAKTGDGAGLLTQIPHRLLRHDLDRWGVALERDEDLGVGMVFLPRPDELARETCRLIVEEALMHFDLPLFGWRKVPVDTGAIGDIAERARPEIEQVLFGRGEGLGDDAFELRIFQCRKAIEHSVLKRGIAGFYVASMSSRTVCYKGMFVAPQLAAFYQDLRSPAFEASLAVFHQRYSTNTFPQWHLAQPFRMLCHNGEINTLAGNAAWIRATETELAEGPGGLRLRKMLPIIQPGGSDSAQLDNTLEAVVAGGRSVQHAMAMLMPEAWEHNAELGAELRAFYAYHSCVVAPWDGPASIVFTDGRVVGATLDRNGLRPARYKITDDGVIVFGSEVGISRLPDSRIVEKGRLGPGRMIAVDTAAGALLRNDEIKAGLAARRPWGAWLREHLVEIPGRAAAAAAAAKMAAPEGEATAEESPAPRAEASHGPRAFTHFQQQLAFGATQEDVRRVLLPMMTAGHEAIGSMGDDTPLAVLSARPRPLHHFFKQKFAQVTNPPIDPLREAQVMSLFVNLGPRRSMFEETPEHAARLRLSSPFLTREQMAAITTGAGARFGVARLDATFDVAEGAAGLDAALARVCAEAEAAAAEGGATILVLSDRGVSAARAPIPALLATGAVHHHLVRRGARLRASLIAETGEVRDTHLFAALLGYGASAVHPWLLFDEVDDLAARRPHLLGGLAAAEAVEHLARAFEEGVQKIMAKMGISSLAGYVGAQLFEAIGVGGDLIARAFAGTPSPIGGIGLDGLAATYLAFHRRATEAGAAAAVAGGAAGEGGAEAERLPNEGFYTWSSKGEHHAFQPSIVRALHAAVRGPDEGRYAAFADAVNHQPPTSPRDLLDFASDREPILLEDVEPVEAIVKRFNTAAMSLGALSREAHETLAVAMNRLGGKSNSGEGGEDPARYAMRDDGDSANSAIKQVASARFGVTPEYLVNAKVLEIKMAQGSKPGEGGQLPGHKVTAEIAAVRHSVAGVTLISPPPHHDIYSIEDLAQLIFDLKAVNPRARVAVKLVARAGVGTIAAGVAKASADVIHISGHDGGTGASPLSSIKHAGSAWEIGLAEAHQVLVLNNMRGHVTVRADGGLRTGRDVLMAALLGAEEYTFGTAALVAAGCLMARQCHQNTCPVGIASQRADLRAKFAGTPEHLVAYFRLVAEEVRALMATLGYDNLNELIGRTDLLRQKGADAAGPRDPAAAAAVDLTAMLAQVDPQRKRAHRRIRARNNNPHAHFTIDEALLVDAHDVIVRRRGRLEREVEITNTDRAVGAHLAGEIAFLHGDAGLGDDAAIVVRCRGSAGQNFGAFCLRGMTLHLAGEANDYVAKGMAGGEIAIRPGDDAAFAAHENVIVGNTVLYGTTGGELHVSGRAGERFAVRNSGAVAVVEGVGDHGCEYMTGGEVVVLGTTGRNFGAGMTGGVAFVHDATGEFPSRCNDEFVEARRPTPEEFARLRALVERHVERTGSEAGAVMLTWWDTPRATWWVVAPRGGDQGGGKTSTPAASEGDGVARADLAAPAAAISPLALTPAPPAPALR